MPFEIADDPIIKDREHTHIEYENIIQTPYYFRENMKLPSLYYYVIRQAYI